MKRAIVKIARDSEDAIRKLSETINQINGKANAFPDAQYRVVETNLTTLNSIDLTQFPNEEMLVPFFHLRSQLAEGLSYARLIKERPLSAEEGSTTLAAVENLNARLSLEGASQEVNTASRNIAQASGLRN